MQSVFSYIGASDASGISSAFIEPSDKSIVMETIPSSLWYMEKEEIIASVRWGWAGSVCHHSFDLLSGISD